MHDKMAANYRAEVWAEEGANDGIRDLVPGLHTL